MVNRRLAKAARAVHKKKVKASRKAAHTDGTAKVAAASSTRTTFFTGGGPGIAGNSSGKLKISAKKLKGGGKGSNRQSRIEALKKQRSALRKQQQVERMTLKEHTAELERRKLSIRKGDSAKQERRELGKYIRQLKEEQQVKHAADLANIEAELKRLLDADTQVDQRSHQSRFAVGQNKNGNLNEEDGDDDWQDVQEIGSEDSIDEEGLQSMFAHLIA